MPSFSLDELEAAHKALLSSHRKIEKARTTLLHKQPLPKSQLTLAVRNLDALRVALSLVSGELEKSNTTASVADSALQGDTQRLAAFDAICNELASRIMTISAELKKLKAEGKEKTVRYRELFAQKIIASHIVTLFERHGVLIACKT